MSAMPPCVLSSCEYTKAHTFVVKTDTFGPLQAFGAASLVKGTGAVAQVQLPSGECYFVLTGGTPRTIQHTVVKLAADIRKLPAAPAIEWVRPLTTRLQRLFAWGDVTATRQDVERAVAMSDSDGLRDMLPQAAAVIDEDDQDALSLLPDIFDAARGALAIEDNPDPERVYAMHEALGCHVWSERTNRKSVCARCERNEPHECACGCRRCKACIDTPPPLAPVTKWQQHPGSAAPILRDRSDKNPGSGEAGLGATRTGG
jgi:hypothetical protein